MTRIVRRQTINWQLDGYYANVTAQQSLAIAGRLMVEEIRKNIPPPRGRGQFPGYAARGTLNRAVQSCKRPRAIGQRAWICTVDIDRRSPAIIYAHVHEYGLVIRPRYKPFLVFRNEQGQLVFAKRVYIKPKHFFSDGVRNGIRVIQRELPPYFVNFTNEKRWPSR